MIPEVNASIAGSQIFVFICFSFLLWWGTTEPGHNKNMPFSTLRFCSKTFKHAKSTFVVREFQFIHSFMCGEKWRSSLSWPNWEKWIDQAYHDPIDDGHAICMAWMNYMHSSISSLYRSVEVHTLFFFPIPWKSMLTKYIWSSNVIRNVLGFIHLEVVNIPNKPLELFSCHFRALT